MTRVVTRRKYNKRSGAGKGGHRVKVNGLWRNIYLVRIAYRCQQCHSPLRIVNFGLKCQADQDHRGYIHQRDVAKIKAQQVAYQQQLGQFYTIRDGKVIIQED